MKNDLVYICNTVTVVVSASAASATAAALVVVAVVVVVVVVVVVRINFGNLKVTDSNCQFPNWCRGTWQINLFRVPNYQKQ